MLNNITPARAGHVVPENDVEARWRGAPTINLNNNAADSPTTGAVEQDGRDHHERLARLQASLKREGGFMLHDLADGAFLITRWNYSRALPGLHAVGAFLRQVTGRSA